MQTALNFPTYPIRIRIQDKRTEVFDVVRKRWLVLTPEEWVRQHLLHYLIIDKGYPASLLAVEKTISVNGLKKRCDVVAFDSQARPIVVVECKAPEVNITQAVFDQIARYNLTLNVNYLLVTNGMQHFCCSMNHQEQRYNFLKELPAYPVVK